MDLQERFARNLRVMLAESQIKHGDIHRKTGISRNTIAKVTSGKSKMIKFETIEQIAKVLEIEPCELFK